MDAQALLSLRELEKQRRSGFIKDVIISVEVEGKVISRDESIRNINEKLLKRMPPAFCKRKK